MSSDAGAGSGSGIGTLDREPVGPDQGAVAGLVWTMYEDVDVITAIRDEIFLQSEESPDRGALVAFLASWDIAWQELASTRPEVIAAITRLTDEELNSVGLTGAQLSMKLSAWRRVRARMLAEFDDGVPAASAVRRLPQDDVPPAGVQVEERSLPQNRPNIFSVLVVQSHQRSASATPFSEALSGSVARRSGSRKARRSLNGSRGTSRTRSRCRDLLTTISVGPVGASCKAHQRHAPASGGKTLASLAATMAHSIAGGTPSGIGEGSGPPSTYPTDPIIRIIGTLWDERS